MEPIFAGNIYVRSSIKFKGLLLVAMFVGRMEPNEKLYRRSYIDASCQDCFNLAKMFQRRRFV
jgi:hypothetical protein